MAYRAQFERGPYRQGTAYRRDKNHKKKKKVINPWRDKYRREKKKRAWKHPKIRKFAMNYADRRLRQYNRYWILVNWEELSSRDHKKFYDPWIWE